MEKRRYLGFLGFLGFLGVGAILAGNYVQAPLILFFAFFYFFVAPASHA